METSSPGQSPREWLPVKGYEGLYDVSSDGMIRSLHARCSHHGTYLLIGQTKNRGYLQVILRDGGARCVGVHRLVASAFIGEPLPGQHVRHLDGNKQNNRLENLAVGSAKENMADRERHGRTARGERSGAVRITARQATDIRKRYRPGEVRQVDLAAEYGLGQSHISRILRGESWKHLLK